MLNKYHPGKLVKQEKKCFPPPKGGRQGLEKIKSLDKFLSDLSLKSILLRPVKNEKDTRILILKIFLASIPPSLISGGGNIQLLKSLMIYEKSFSP